MADGGRQDVLGQKAQAAQRAFEARGMSPAKALRRALSRAADVLWDLALVGQTVHLETLDQDGVIGGLGEDTLLILIDGPDGALGIVELDREMVTGIVEVQTIRQVTNMPADDRPFSGTDAAMMAPLIDSTMERLAGYLEGNPILPQLQGFHFGAMVEDARTAAHLLDASGYRAFRADIDLALGRRKGRISFFFPERVIKARPATPENQPEGPHEQEMLRVPARLDCVLARVKIPLSRAGELRAGDLLELPGSVLDEAELRAARGLVVAKGRLGQLNGLRALRILWPKGAAPARGAAPVAPDAVPGLPDFARSGPEPMMAAADAPMARDSGGMELSDIAATPPTDSPEAAAAGQVDFAAEAAAFDLDEFDGGFEAGALPEADAAFGAEAGQGGPDGEEAFASAPMDFDFDS